jgi:hypothetical protein
VYCGAPCRDAHWEAHHQLLCARRPPPECVRDGCACEGDTCSSVTPLEAFHLTVDGTNDIMHITAQVRKLPQITGCRIINSRLLHTIRHMWG